MSSLKTLTHTSLIECVQLETRSSVNGDFFLHTVDDILRQLDNKRGDFALLLTHSGCYMSLTCKTPKELYPSLMHVTCIAHLLHNCTIRVRAY